MLRYVLALISVLAVGLHAADVLTARNDNQRLGVNTNETVLTPTTIKSGAFAKLKSIAVDGYVYTQPLVVTGIEIKDGETRDLLIACTEHNTVYAFDANSLKPIWHVSLKMKGTTVPYKDVGSEDLVPEIGITSTPVIDKSTKTIYVVAKTKTVVAKQASYHLYLHALNLINGKEKQGGPVELVASVPGTGDGNDGSGNVPFNSLRQHQRSALLLSGGNIYIASASHGDNGPYHGWVLAYDASTLQLSGAYNSTPNGGLGGIWEAGDGPAADEIGDVYVATGNGTFTADSGGQDYGDSILRLSIYSSLYVVDWFTPYNQQQLNDVDNDLGSGGLIVLPGADKYVIQGGKEGTLYVLNRSNMGHFNANDNSQIVQELTSVTGGLFSTPTFWNNQLYVLGTDSPVRVFPLSNGLFATTTTTQTPENYGFASSIAMSANGTTNGIVWALENSNAFAKKPGVLRAYDASDLTSELFSSDGNKKNACGKAVKFSVPTIANGKVYVGGQKTVTVYGLKN